MFSDTPNYLQDQIHSPQFSKDFDDFPPNYIFPSHLPQPPLLPSNSSSLWPWMFLHLHDRQSPSTGKAHAPFPHIQILHVFKGQLQLFLSLQSVSLSFQLVVTSPSFTSHITLLLLLLGPLHFLFLNASIFFSLDWIRRYWKQRSCLIYLHRLLAVPQHCALHLVGTQ